MVFDAKELQDILVCPQSKSPLIVDREHLFCTDPQCRLRFDIRDQIPIMLSDEAVQLTPEQWQSEMQRHGRPVSEDTNVES